MACVVPSPTTSTNLSPRGPRRPLLEGRPPGVPIELVLRLFSMDELA